jgi:hypothetical protein
VEETRKQWQSHENPRMIPIAVGGLSRGRKRPESASGDTSHKSYLRILKRYVKRVGVKNLSLDVRH